MKVLTLNTWQERGPWQERWELIFQGLNRFQPQIVGFQELFNPTWAQEVQKRISLKEMIATYENGGLAIYSQYPILENGFRKLAQSPLEDYQRFILWAKLQIRQKELFVFNTHLSWKTEDSTTRQKQVKEVIEILNQEAKNSDLILMGDHNATPDSIEIRELMKNARLTDLYNAKHPNSKDWTWDNRNPYAANSSHKMADRRIDYLFTKSKSSLEKNLKSCEIVLNQKVKDVWASDHFGVLAEFKEN